LYVVAGELTGCVVAGMGLSVPLREAFCIILVLGSVLQVGRPQVAQSGGVGAPALALGTLIVPPAIPEPSSVFAGALLLAYCMLVAHVAFARVLATHGEHTKTRALNTRLQRYLPHTLAERVDANSTPGLERRWLVVVFADLVGFTTMIERLQMEEVATVLDGYLQRIADVTKRWGGTLSKVLGDGALLVFGEEGRQSHKHLVKQALGCCGELGIELRKLTSELQGGGLPGAACVKIGIASGYCSLGDWGAGERLEYTVIGHPVNLASRLQDLAAPGDTLLCERTSLLAEASLSPTMQHPVKGLGEVSYRKIKAPEALSGELAQSANR